MLGFIRKHAASVIGILSGFDRLVLRGTLRSIAFTQGLTRYLNYLRPLRSIVEA